MKKILAKIVAARIWLHRHPKTAYSIVIVGIIVFAALSAYLVNALSAKPAFVPDIVIKPQPKPKYYSPLTGKLVGSKAATTKPVTAVMIENSPDARPQSGLKDAEIVYEAIAEGGITRFLALYQQSKPKLIGPVRSVRMYYVDWLTPYNASVAHVGGSYKALKLVRNGRYRDIDQFFNPGTYWRASDRYAPHNVYTSSAKLTALNKAKGFKTSHPAAFERASTKPATKRTATNVAINISSDLYNSTYRYNPKTKLYARSMGGVPHLDREKGQIRPRVVVALRVSMTRVFEDGYRESIKTIGSGDAVIFQDGKATKATWKKSSRKGQHTFMTKSGKPFKLARGTTWISAVPTKGGSVSWK